jgi:parallel beta-helix repeat protein
VRLDEGDARERRSARTNPAGKAGDATVRIGRSGIFYVCLALLVAGSGCPPRAGERPLPALVGAPAADSTLVGCDRADETIVLSSSAHLDPSCTYARGIEIRASDVVLDCRGARIEDATGAASRGILVAAPISTALANVTVRNCVVAGFLNNVRVTREGFKTLAEGAEYENAFADVVVENSHLYASRGSGIFVDGYVTGVTLRDLDIAFSGGVGIYLEAGSKDSVVVRNTIRESGFGDVVPEGVPFDLGGVAYRYLSTGREGIAVDGSRDNVITDNVIEGSSAGGIFLYKNCGEYATERPNQWWTRRYGADGNRIERNLIRDETSGVWIGSRMAENQYFMDCSDPAYVSGGLVRVHRDLAANNVVADNTFVDVTWGVRVEDDGNRVERNSFFSDRSGAQAVLVGTKSRTQFLLQPVANTVIADNHALIPANAEPYRWIHGHAGTVFEGNLRYAESAAAGTPAALVQGTQPRINPFLFVVDLWPAE